MGHVGGAPPAGPPQRGNQPGMDRFPTFPIRAMRQATVESIQRREGRDQELLLSRPSSRAPLVPRSPSKLGAVRLDADLCVLESVQGPPRLPAVLAGRLRRDHVRRCAHVPAGRWRPAMTRQLAHVPSSTRSVGSGLGGKSAARASSSAAARIRSLIDKATLLASR